MNTRSCDALHQSHTVKTFQRNESVSELSGFSEPDGSQNFSRTNFSDDKQSVQRTSLNLYSTEKTASQVEKQSHLLMITRTCRAEKRNPSSNHSYVMLIYFVFLSFFFFFFFKEWNAFKFMELHCISFWSVACRSVTLKCKHRSNHHSPKPYSGKIWSF